MTMPPAMQWLKDGVNLDDLTATIGLARHDRLRLVDGPAAEVLPGIALEPDFDTHTWGHQYVVVDNDHDGRWILPGDAVYTYANLEALSQPFPGGSAPDGAARPGAASPGCRPGRNRRSGPQAAGGDGPHRLHPVPAEADDLVGQVGAGAGVERVEAQLLAELDRLLRPGHAVLLREALDEHAAVGGPGDVAGAGPADDPAVPAERLGAAVDGEALRRPMADHRAQRRQRELALGGRAGPQVHQVVEDVGAGARLGDARHLGDPLAGERPAGGDLADLDASRAQLLGDVHQQAALVVTGVLGPGRALVPDAAVGGQAVELDAGQRADRPGELLDLRDLRHRHATPVQPAVDVDLEVDRDARRHRRLRRLLGRRLVVAVHRHAHGAGGHRGDAAPLGRAEHRVGDADVVDPGGDERLRLTRLGADDAPSARVELHACDLGDLVGLDVGAEADLVAVHDRLPLGDVPLEPVKVAEDRRCIQVGHELGGLRLELCHLGPPIQTLMADGRRDG